MTNEYGLQKIFEVELKLLNEVERICKKHDIKYMLDCGTLIGAIRHKGFIPWDDDVDIAFTRDEYERFKRIAPTELPKSMNLFDPMNLAEFNAFHDHSPRIMYLNSRKCAPNAETEFYHDGLNHLCVDIWIFDKLPDEKIKAFWLKTRQKIYYFLSMGHRKELDWSKYTFFQKIVVWVFSTIGKTIPMTKLCKNKDELAKKYNYLSTKELYCSNYPPEYYDMHIESKWCDETVYVPFEDTQLKVSKCYEDFLAVEYKDYKTLPPVEERVPAHGTEMVEIYE